MKYEIKENMIEVVYTVKDIVSQRKDIALLRLVGAVISESSFVKLSQNVEDDVRNIVKRAIDSNDLSLLLKERLIGLPVEIVVK